MLIERKDHEKPPAPVAESWRRIEAWLDEHLPGLTLTLRPGISGEDLAKFEAAIGRALPDDVRESWKIHDGQQYFPEGVKSKHFFAVVSGGAPGVIFGQELNPLLSYPSLSGNLVLQEWSCWSRSLATSPEQDADALDEVDEGCASFPDGAIRRQYTNRGWIPLGMGKGSSNYFGVDLDPGPNGVVGQVINFGVDEEEKYVLAGSWAQFLEDVADELEAGNFVGLERHHGPSRWFLMREPRVGKLCEHDNYRAWSEAKVAPRPPKRGRKARAGDVAGTGTGRSHPAGDRGKTSPPRRSAQVNAGKTTVGRFALPTTEDAKGSRPRRRRLVIPPERLGDGNPNLLWTEIGEDGEAVTMMWVPKDERDREEMERFWEACQAIDWDDPGIHEVSS